jgi:hypothetical protein
LVIPETNIPDGESRQVQIRLRTISISGPIFYTSNLLVVDSYVGQPLTNPVTSIVTDISANTTGYYFDTSGSLLYTITTAGIPDDTLYYTLSGNISAGETSPFNGSVSIVNNTGTILMTGAGTASVDKIQNLQIRRGSISGTVLETDNNDVLLSTYAGPIIATGGIIEDGGGYRKHIFTQSNIFTITTASYDPLKINMDYMIVGGGGGGLSVGEGGAGGGGGGVQIGTFPLLATKGSYTANIGGGGASNSPGTTTDIALHPTFVGLGGGTGNANGGSGGGGRSSSAGIGSPDPGGIATQPAIGSVYGTNYGNPGGVATRSISPPSYFFDFVSSGAGGGAGGAGGNGSPANGGDGGSGIALPWSPATIGAYPTAQAYNWNPSTNTWNPFPGAQPGGTRYFAGGGGGSSEQNNPGPSPGGIGGGGAANPSALYNPPAVTGMGRGQPAIETSGGGGGGGAHGPGAVSGTGGSGVIIIRYPYS